MNTLKKQRISENTHSDEKLTHIYKMDFSFWVPALQIHLL